MKYKRIGTDRRYDYGGNLKITICVVFLMFFSILFSINTIDSLETALDTAVGKDKISILNKLSAAYKSIDAEMGLECGFQALELAAKENDLKTKSTALNNIGNSYRVMRDYDSSIKYYHKALSLCRQINEKKSIANILNNIGHDYWFLGDLPQSLHYYREALIIFVELGDKKAIGLTYNNIGSVYSRLSNYSKALEYFLNALKIREEIKDQAISSTLNNLGNVFLRLNNYNKALENYLRALKLKEELKDKRAIASTLNNIGNVYLEKGNYEKALFYYDRALSINEELGNKKRIASTLNNIGIVYEYLNKSDLTMDFYSRSLKIKKEVGDKYGIANAYKNIGNLYYERKMYDKSLECLEQALLYATKIEAKNIEKDIHEILSNLYFARKDFKEAFKHKAVYSDIKDSIFNESTSEKIAEMQTNYETEKTEKENELLLKDNLIYKLQLEKENLTRLRLYMILVVVLSLSLIVYYRYKSKNRENLLLEKAKNSLEEKVKLRTVELANSNVELKNEIDVRKKAEKAINDSLKEKEVMLKEIHHRVKNNLQVISSMLNLQSYNEKNDSAKLSLFKNTQNRIYSMSLVHEKLYQSGNLAYIEFDKYIYSLVTYLLCSYRINTNRIKFISKIDDISLNINTAIPCGLLINELITNFIKHAFPGKTKGEIRIEMTSDNKKNYILIVRNNGVKFPDTIDINNPKTVGLELVRLLAKQLHSKIELDTSEGVSFTFRIKELK